MLDRLDRREFRYREFVDPIADLEPWPLFTALLNDERVVGRRNSDPVPHVGQRASLFDRYEPRDEPSGREDAEHTPPLGAFLASLSPDQHRTDKQ